MAARGPNAYIAAHKSPSLIPMKRLSRITAPPAWYDFTSGRIGGDAGGDAGGGSGRVAGAAAAASGGLIRFAAVLAVASKAATVLSSAVSDAAKTVGGRMAAGRGDVAGALSYRMQNAGWASALPIVGGLFRSAHEYRMESQNIPGHIAAAGTIEQQRFAGMSATNALAVQSAGWNIQSRYLHPADASLQMRRLGIAAAEAGLSQQMDVGRGLAERYRAKQKEIGESSGIGRDEPLKWYDLIPYASLRRFIPRTKGQKETALAESPESMEFLHWSGRAGERDALRAQIAAGKSSAEALWKTEMYSGMTPQAAPHWSAFGLAPVPTAAPAADPSVSQLVQINTTLKAIELKLGKG